MLFLLYRIKKMGSPIIPPGFLRPVQRSLGLLSAYVGFEFGKSEFGYGIFPSFLGFPEDKNIVLVWQLTFNAIYWAIAFGWSAFLAAYAFQLHGGSKTVITIKEKDKMTKREESVYYEGYGKIGLPKSIQQFVFNFLGSMFGWLIISIIIFNFSRLNLSSLEIALISAIAFVSVSGYLPYLLVTKNWFPTK